MNKTMTLHYVHPTTIKETGNVSLGGGVFMAFDFEPDSKKKMLGIAITSSKVAETLSKDFSVMAKVLKTRGK
jgi:hypothetical protein